MTLLLDQVVSLREQIKRRQQGLDNGKEVTPASHPLRHEGLQQGLVWDVLPFPI